MNHAREFRSQLASRAAPVDLSLVKSLDHLIFESLIDGMEAPQERIVYQGLILQHSSVRIKILLAICDAPIVTVLFRSRWPLID